MKSLLIIAFLATAAWAMDDAEISEVFNLDDMNRDGRLEESELVQQFGNLDTNKDGIVDVNEIFALVTTAQTLTEAQVILRSFDFNKDGKVNVTDFTQSFKNMDANADGSVSILEYANAVRFYPGRSEIILLANGADGIGMVFANDDTDNDGQLSPAEFKAIFVRWDTDADDKVSLAEYEAGFGAVFKLNNNETTIIFNKVDSNGDGFADDAERTVLFNRIDVDGTGSISQLEFVTTIIELIRETKFSLAMQGAVYPSVDEQIQKLIDNGVDSLFVMRDADKDGFVTTDEEKAAIKMGDTNGDGVLSMDETVSSLSYGLRVRMSVAKVMFKALDANADGTFDDSDLAVFMKEADYDGDGKLNKGEFSGATIALVTMARLVDAKTLTFESAEQILEGVVGLARLFETYDLDGDYLITSAEFDTEGLQKLDLTGDSKLSMLEFLPRFATTFAISIQEAAEIFRKIDANGDQMIDVAEGRGFFNKFDVDGDSFVTVKEFTGTVLREISQVRSLVGIQGAASIFG